MSIVTEVEALRRHVEELEAANERMKILIDALDRWAQVEYVDNPYTQAVAQVRRILDGTISVDE